jgi:hypothetical protein
VLLLALAGGCGQPVREDRSINWSTEGGQVGFQHGQQGVYVADKDGAGLTKIFQPAADVLAVSSPLWSPTARQAIFTTARDPQGNSAFRWPFDPVDNPAGNVHWQQAVLYTCWLYDEPAAGAQPKPTALFETSCNHVGYIAANLAVRWHPSGDRILYLRDGGGQTALFEYDLQSKRAKQIFPHTADALIFDWAPDGSHLVCVLGSVQGPQPNDGIWIGVPGQNNWWHVPESHQLAYAEIPSVLERLRATRPAWATDAQRFAFANCTTVPVNAQPGRHGLWLGYLPEHQVEWLDAGTQPYHDLHWAPDGQRLGLLRGGEQSSLHFLKLSKGMSAPITDRPVRRFAGWNAKGDKILYTVPDHIPGADQPMWTFLLVPDPLARDAVCIADGQGDHAGKELFSGLRVTFPQFSPHEDKLSLWGTFTPTHRSWISHMLRWGLRPGDPAAIFDLKSGRMSWLAINLNEKVQVGHYYLLKRNYAEALHWYEEARWLQEAEAQLGAAANRDLAPAVTARSFLESLTDLSGPRDFGLFQYYCLTKLGRQKEAQRHLARFKSNFWPTFDVNADGQAGVQDEAWERQLQQVLKPDSPIALLLRDLYIGEVFLSLDAAADGATFFRAALAQATTDPARLSAALVLSQMLLAEKKYTDYAELAIETIVPLLIAMKSAARVSNPLFDVEALIELAATFSLVPLFIPDFLAGISEESCWALIAKLEVLRDRATPDVRRRPWDLVLVGLHRRLGLQPPHETVHTNSGMPFQIPDSEDMNQEAEKLRQQVRGLFLMRLY